MWCLVEHNISKVVTFKCLEVGHTFNPCDQSAGVVERRLKRFKTIEMAEQLYDIMKVARTKHSPFQVVQMQQQEFLAWKTWGAERYIVLKRRDRQDKEFMISRSRQLRIGPGSSRTLHFRYTFLPNEPPNHIEIDRNRKRPLPLSAPRRRIMDVCHCQ